MSYGQRQCLSARSNRFRGPAPLTRAVTGVVPGLSSPPGVVVPARRDEAEASMCAVERVSDGPSESAYSRSCSPVSEVARGPRRALRPNLLDPARGRSLIS
jgi:hypothetical protein